MEQGKSILDGNPGLFNSKFLGDPAFNEGNDVVAEEAKDYPRERRPALGHKRARFWLKPNKIHSAEFLKPTLDIDNLKDPEQLFMAYEQLENAKREIQKQMGGVSFVPNQNYTYTNAWQHRPGLLGNNQRKSVRYKHLYLMETSNSNDHNPSSQEIFESGSLGLPEESKDKTLARLASLESELDDSSVVEGNKINDILDALLESSFEDLDADGAITLLQESLQISPFILEKLSIPDLPNNRESDLKSFGGSLLKPRKALSNIDNLLKEMRNRTPLKIRQDVGSPVYQLASASPTPPKSPFAPLSSLLKRSSLAKLSVDPFPMLHSDNSSTGNPPVVNQEVSLVNSGKQAPLINDVVAVRKTSLFEDSIRKCDSSSGKSKEHNSEKPSNKMNALLTEDVIAVSKTSSVEDTIRNCASTSGKSKEDNSKVHEENMQEAVASVSRDDPDFSLVNPLDQSSPPRVQANAMDECTRTSDGCDAERCLQVKEKAVAPSMPVNEQSEDKSHVQRDHKNKGLSWRQSLEAAGTSWKSGVRQSTRIKTRPLEYWKGERLLYGRIHETASTSSKSGVRRSTRIKTRPLEYWKGERLLYGRIHESLATVIGVKYLSPESADGKPTMKVRSYVSDEHKELLELASQY